MPPSASHRPRLLSLAWPIFVEQGLRVAIGTVDTFMVSHLGDDAVAGVNVAMQIVTLFVISFAFIGIGSSIVITHHLGANDRAGADRISVNAIAANSWIGLLASVVVFLFSDALLDLMRLPDAPAEYARPFLVLMGGTLFLEAANVAVASTLRAHAFTRDAMLVALGQNVLNVIGNFLLLFGLFGCPKLGVVGVAVSGVISRIAAFGAQIFLLKWRTGLQLRVRDYFAIQRDKLGKILHIGLPAAGEHTSWWLAFMVITGFVAGMGTTELATFSYTMQIIRWVILFNVSIGLGTEIVVGYLIGAGLFEDAYRELLRSVRLAFIWALAGATVLAVAAPYIIGAFSHDPAVIAGGAFLIRLGFFLETGRVFNVVVINSLRATGDARFPMKMGLIFMWGLWVPLAWFFGVHLGWGLPGVWLSMILDEWTRGMIMFGRWRRRKWLPYAERSRAQAQGIALGEAQAATVAEG